MTAFNLTIPILETERLILREFRQTDFPAFRDFVGSERATYYGGQMDPGGAWRKMSSYAGSWIVKGYGPWALEEKATGDFVGLCGHWDPEGWPEPEITWALMNHAEGKGFASEAASFVRDYTLNEMGWTRITSCIHPENAPSIRLVERIGGTYEGDVPFPYGIGRLYRHKGAATLPTQTVN